MLRKIAIGNGEFLHNSAGQMVLQAAVNNWEDAMGHRHRFIESDIEKIVTHGRFQPFSCTGEKTGCLIGNSLIMPRDITDQMYEQRTSADNEEVQKRITELKINRIASLPGWARTLMQLPEAAALPPTDLPFGKPCPI